MNSNIVASTEDTGFNHEHKVINEPIDSKVVLILKCVVSGIALSLYLAFFKTIFDDEKAIMRIWEDLYGRSVFFFLCSVASYLYYSTHNLNISFFELESKIRWYFALRLLTQCLSYGFLALALAQGRGIAIPVLTILGSQSILRILVIYTRPNMS